MDGLTEPFSAKRPSKTLSLKKTFMSLHCLPGEIWEGKKASTSLFTSLLLASHLWIGLFIPGASHAQTRLDTANCKLVLATTIEAAKSLYRQKADSGDACAQFNLGYSYYSNQSFEGASLWYGAAAAQGHAKAQFELAVLYRDGMGTPKNSFKAAKWMQKAAEQGEPDAQLELGVMYERGEGVLLNESKAVYWLTKAANQGSDLAQFNLGVKYRTDVSQTMDASSGDARINPDDNTAMHWFCKAAMQGYAPAQFQVGDAYKQGRGVKVNYEQTRLWYRKAAAQGDEKSAVWLRDDLSGPWYYVAEKWLKLQALRFRTATCPQ